MLESQDFQLTLEQQLHLRNVTDASTKMTLEQLQEQLVKTTALLMVNQNLVKGLMKKSFGG